MPKQVTGATGVYACHLMSIVCVFSHTSNIIYINPFPIFFQTPKWTEKTNYLLWMRQVSSFFLPSVLLFYSFPLSSSCILLLYPFLLSFIISSAICLLCLLSTCCFLPNVWLLLSVLQVCEIKNCNKCIFFEAKKKKDLYMWWVWSLESLLRGGSRVWWHLIC